MGKILHLLWAGEMGGIENLCFSIGKAEPHKHIFVFVHSAGKIFEEMRCHSLNVECLYLGNKDVKKLIDYFRKLCRTENIDAVLIHHDATMIWIASIFFVQNHKIKTFLYAHCNYRDFIDHNYVKEKAFKLAANKCTGIVAVSESVKNSILENMKYPEDQIYVVYNGIELSRFKDTACCKKDDCLHIVYVGRLIEEKGIQLLIEALSKLKHQINFLCEIIGDGIYREVLEGMIDQYELKDCVHLLGIQTDIPRYLRNADIFVHPAIWEEGFGITLVEAMACGLPCICFSKGAIPELVEDGVNGFLIDEVSAQSLADRILLAQTKISNGTIEAIRENAIITSKKFSIENTVKSIWQIVNE